MATPWLVVPDPKAAPSLRMICFPYAGGGASVFRPWVRAMPAAVELLSVQMPGRESRFAEPALPDLDRVLEGLLPALAPRLDRPFVFFGHSLGALLAFETARALRRQGGPLPIHLLLSGRRAAHVPMERRPFHDLPADELIGEVRKLNHGGSGMLDDPDMASLALPMLRADFAVHDTYSYRPEPGLDVPFSIFGGLADQTTPVESLREWRVLSTRRTTVSLFPGGHFFLETERRDVLAVVIQRLHEMVDQSSKAAA
jgi:medium-chain acyl-[acyl-carrier-protein] hydrolase